MRLLKLRVLTLAMVEREREIRTRHFKRMQALVGNIFEETNNNGRLGYFSFLSLLFKVSFFLFSFFFFFSALVKDTIFSSSRDDVSSFFNAPLNNLGL